VARRANPQLADQCHYMGRHEYGKRAKVQRQTIVREVPAIVDEATWTKAQQVLKSNFLFGIRGNWHVAASLFCLALPVECRLSFLRRREGDGAHLPPTLSRIPECGAELGLCPSGRRLGVSGWRHARTGADPGRR
jgi:hypothetical protein